MKSFVFKFVRYACASGALVTGLAMSGLAAAAQEEQFSTPQEAIKALAAAIVSKDTNALNAIFGPELHSLVSADAVQASNRFQAFARRISEKTELEKASDDKMILNIGNDDWPFPIPVVRRDGQWSFDTEAGREEILNRLIGANELGTIRVCHAYVDAQRPHRRRGVAIRPAIAQQPRPA
jgi:hypothetical protein